MRRALIRAAEGVSDGLRAQRRSAWRRKTDYIINIRGAPFIPRPGEYVVVREQEMDEEGVVSAFKIRYAVTYANRTGQEADASSDLTAVEGEPISHPHQTAAHRRNVEMYQSQGLTVEAFPESGY